MSKSKSKKKVTVGKKREVTATTSRRTRTSSISTQPETLLFEKTNLVLTQGFIGATDENESTTYRTTNTASFRLTFIDETYQCG